MVEVVDCGGREWYPIPPPTTTTTTFISCLLVPTTDRPTDRPTDHQLATRSQSLEEPKNNLSSPPEVMMKLVEMVMVMVELVDMVSVSIKGRN